MTADELARFLPHASAQKVADFIGPLNDAMRDFHIDENVDRECHFLAQIAHESNSLNAVSENLNYSAQGLVDTFPRYFDTTTAADYARKPDRIANRVYAGRMGNGDEDSGDGWRYRGAGLIQITGADNQSRVAQAFAMNVQDVGDWMRTPQGSSSSAAWFWDANNLNPLADADDIQTISAIINTGRRNAPVKSINGYSYRVAYLTRARAIFA